MSTVEEIRGAITAAGADVERANAKVRAGISQLERSEQLLTQAANDSHAEQVPEIQAAVQKARDLAGKAIPAASAGVDTANSYAARV